MKTFDYVRPATIAEAVAAASEPGAAYLAGLAAGLFKDTADIAARWALDRRFAPALAPAARDALYEGWLKAVGRVRA